MHHHNQSGFTLTETIVIIALFTIVMLAVTGSIASFYKLNSYTIAQSYQVDNARRGVDLLVRDLREMTFADDGTFPLVVMEDYRVGFFSDIDRDDSVEYVEYELSTTTFRAHIYNATGTPPVYDTSVADAEIFVSEYVQNELYNTPVFVYYDNMGNLATGTTTVTDIQYIQVNIIVNIDSIRNPGEYMLRSSAALRNL